jgi:hypothetical protein
MADIDLKIGADTAELDKGSEAVKKRLDEISSSVGTLQSSLDTFASKTAEAFSTVTDALGSIGDGFKQLNETIEKGGATLSTGWMKLLFGGAIGAAAAGALKVFHDIEEEFVKMDRAARETGLSLQRYQEIQYALNQGGVGNDKVREGLEEASKKLNEMVRDSGDLGKFLDANGVKWKDQNDHIISMDRYLVEASKLIENAYGWADKFKAGELLGFSKEWVRTLAEGPAHMQELEARAHAAGAVMQDEMVAKAVAFEKEWNAASSHWATFFKQMIVDLTPYVQNLINMLGIAVEKMQGLERGSTKGSGAEGLMATQKFENPFKTAPGAGDMPLPSMAGLDVGAEKTTQMRVDWDKIVADAKRVADDVVRAGSTKFAKDDDDDKKKDTTGMTKLQEQLDAIRLSYDKIKIAEKNAVDTFKETETQKVKHLLAALTDRETAEKAVFEKEIALAGDNANKQEQIRRKMAHEMGAIDKERLALEAEQLKKSVQEWEGVTNTIMGAWNSQLRGLLAHTTSWSTAMKNIASSLVIKMIEEFEKLAIVKPLSNILANSLSAPTELFSGFMKMISGLLGPLSAGFTSFFAPTLGPAAPAAGAAAAAAEVAVAKATVGSFEIGTDYVPRTGMALVHQGEAIIPASQNMGGGGQGAAANVTFQVSAIDGTGVQAFLTRFGPQFAKMVAGHMSQNPSYSSM